MMKKIISLLLVVCMLAACCTVFAADTTQQKADALYLLGLFKGTDEGYELNAHTTREQGVTMLVRLLGKSEEANSGTYTTHFTDVYDWAKGYVGYAYDKGITLGMSETEFGYGVELTDAMFLTMLMRIVGYTEGEGEGADFVWNDPYSVAQNLGLIQSSSADTDFSRGDLVEIIYNALSVDYKGTTTSVASQLMTDGVFDAETMEQATKVAEGATTLKDAQDALAGSTGSGETGGSEGGTTGGETGGTTGGETGGSTGGGEFITDPAVPAPTPGIGGDYEESTTTDNRNHETDDIEV